MTFNPTSTFDSIIYRPGGVSAGDVLATWAEVKTFIQASSNGKCIVYVDDTIVSPALVPAATGITECGGRVQLYPYAEDADIFSVLQIEPGATLNNLATVTGMELRCNPQTPTPSLDFTITPNGGALLVTNDALLSNAATATTAAIHAPVGPGKFVFIQLETGDLLLGAPAVPFIDIPVGAGAEIVALAGSEVSNNAVAGAGDFFLIYDQSCVFDNGIATPAMPGLTGSYSANNIDGTPMMSIIYKPGAVNSPFGDTVNNWTAVQVYLRTARGKCIIYIDDSLVSPALVPGASGVTECFGRVELRPFANDSQNLSVLQIENGATLRNLYAVTGVELRGNAQGATPSLDWNVTPNGGYLYLSQEAILSNAATATNPIVDIPAGKQLFIQSQSGELILNAPAVPLFAVPLTSTFSIEALDASIIANGFASGAGNVSLRYDAASASEFATPGIPPALPGITGTYTAFALDGNNIATIIYKPGVASSPFGDTVGTWAEVQTLITGAKGKFVVYVDDSIVSPALVPGATGVTQCFGRVEIRPYATDSLAFTILQIENGATLKDLWKLTGMELRCNSTSATPSLDWTTTPNGGTLYLEGFSLLSNAATSTNPGIHIPAPKSLFISALFSQIQLHAPAVPLIDIAVGAQVGMLAFDCSWVANVFSGAGSVAIGYDMPTAQGFPTQGTPPPQPALAGAYGLTNVDDLTISQQFLVGATDIFAGGPKFGVRLVKFTGCGNGGAGGGGSGGAAAAPGNGGGGGGASLYQNFDVFIDFTHRIDVIIPANAAGGLAGAFTGDGGNGGDGGTCYVLDFTANVVLCAFAGGSGGGLGALAAGPGLGGASFPNGQRAGNFTTGSAGFLAAGGNGGSQTGPITPGAGNFNISTFGLTPPGPAPNLYAGGLAGANGAAGQGGGGGGGGQGPFGPGGAGGSGNAGTGTQGGDVNVGSPGSGGGGGAGGANGSGGARGGIGSLGQITYSYRP